MYRPGTGLPDAPINLQTSMQSCREGGLHWPMQSTGVASIYQAMLRHTLLLREWFVLGAKRRFRYAVVVL